MICFGIFFALVCLGIFGGSIFLLLPLLVALLRDQVDRKLFRDLANKNQGEQAYRGALRLPETRFEQNEVKYRVRTTRSGSGRGRLQRVLEITASWPDREFHLRLVPKSITARLVDFGGIQDIRTGDKTFDNVFYVQSNNDIDTRRILDIGVRKAVEELVRFGSRLDLEIHVMDGQMTMRRRLASSNKTFLDSQVQRFVTLYERMLVAAADAKKILQAEEAGVRFLSQVKRQAHILDNSTANTERIAVCQVCGTDVLDDHVECRSCNTIHHADCWKYVGVCSTFACGERRYRKPRKKRG